MTDALTGDGAPRCSCEPDEENPPCLHWSSQCALHGEGSAWWRRVQERGRALAQELYPE